MKSVDSAAELLKNTFNKIAAGLIAEMESGSVDTPVVYLTSTEQGGGKTTVSGLLAYHCALISDKRVLLIDGNMDDPQIASLFGVPESGVVESLFSEQLEPVSQPTRLDNFHVMGAGRSPDSTVLFMHHRVEQMIQRLKAQYDLILVDASSADGSAGNSLARCADAVIAVVDASKTRKADLETLHLQLDIEAEKIVGTILNRHRQYTPEFIARLL